MHSYAQTNIQLFNQLHREGYRSAELETVVAAHELTTRLMTGQFRASGKTFIAHLVGTASILGSLHAPSPIVAAALLHAAYSAGDFGDDRLGASDAKRAQLRSAVGDEVEDYVWRYHNLSWDDQTVRTVSLVIRRPVEKLTGLSSGAAHGWATLRTQRDWRAAVKSAKEASARREADLEDQLTRVHD